MRLEKRLQKPSLKNASKEQVRSLHRILVGDLRTKIRTTDFFQGAGNSVRMLAANDRAMGGGVYGDWTAVDYCTVADNRIDGPGRWRGTGVGNGTVRGCIVSGNDADGASRWQYEGEPGGYLALFSTYVGDDPGFVDAANGDYRLLEDSPCVDAGALPANAEGADPGELDLDGNPRVRGNAIDQGCYESAFSGRSEPAAYTIVFRANGGTGTMAPQSVRRYVETALAANRFAKTGCRFAGWAATASGPAVFQDKETVRNLAAADGTVVLYAQWIPTAFRVVFYANGGKGTMATQTISRNKSTKLTANKFTRSGYVFLGWAKSKTGAVAYANGSAVKNLAPAGASVTLYAKWAVAKYKVAFNANGGTLPKGKKMAAQTLAYGKAAALRKNAFVRKGYVFAGWAVKKGGAIAYKNGQTVKNLRTDGKTTTLYAVWAKPTYKVAFYPNGGTGTMAVQTFKYGTAANLAACKFTAPKGRKFAGWATSAANAKAGKVKYKNKQAVKNLLLNGKTVKLYAVWKKK